MTDSRDGAPSTGRPRLEADRSPPHHFRPPAPQDTPQPPQPRPPPPIAPDDQETARRDLAGPDPAAQRPVPRPPEPYRHRPRGIRTDPHQCFGDVPASYPEVCRKIVAWK